MKKKLLLCFFSLFFIGTSFSQSTITTNIVYTGAQANGCCNVCGLDYWCINNTGGCGTPSGCDTRTFFDPVPAGNVVTNIQVQYYSAQCSGASLSATIDGNAVPITNEGSTNCPCSINPCGVSASTSGNYPCGMPGYVYGGNNSFQLCTGADACMQRVHLIITYYNPGQITPTISASGSTNFCQGGSVVLNAGAGYSAYSWSPGGQNTQSITVSTAGTYVVTVTSVTGCTTGTASKTVTVYANPTPAITPTGATTFCSGGSAVLTATGGYSAYSWTPGLQNTQSITVTTSGTYNVTVTDSHGCIGSASSSQNVTVYPSPSVSAAATSSVSCFGGSNGSATATPSGGTLGYTYSWSPSGGNSSAATGLGVGTYTILLTDANGCTATSTVPINQPPLITLTASSTTPTGCTAINGVATATTSGGTPAYTYSWSPSSQTTSAATGLGVGTYTIHLTDANGCSATSTVSVSTTINTPSITAAATSSVSCFGGNNGSATATPSGGVGTYTFSWSPSSQTTSVATGLSFGTTYTVTVVDANGCTATSTVAISQPPSITLTANSTSSVTCNGLSNGSAIANASGGIPGYTYSWNTSVVQTTQTATGLSAVTYSVTVTDANGCTKVTSVTINQPQALSASINTTSVSCNGGNNGSATANPTGGTNPYIYHWNNNQTSQTATGLSAGTYSITITDANGCIKQTTASVIQPTALSTTVSANDSICKGDKATLSEHVVGGTPGYTYLWNTLPAQTTSSVFVSPSNTTSYTVSITDANGCKKNNVTKVVIFPNPTATISATVHSIKLGTQTTLTGTTSTGTYSWAPATDLCCTSCSNPATCPDPVASPMATTTYTLTTTDARGCTASDTITIFVDINCELFVPNAFSPNGDGKNDYLAVRGLCIKDIDFKIFNRWGNVVFATQDPKITTDQTKGWNGSFEGKAMDPGVFFYTLHVTLLDNTTKTITGDITLVR